MAANRPTKQDLVEAVREFLEKRIQPSLEGESSFHTRIAVNILKIIEREFEHGPGLDAEEHERLHRLLERDASLAELNSELDPWLSLACEPDPSNHRSRHKSDSAWKRDH